MSDLINSLAEVARFREAKELQRVINREVKTSLMSANGNWHIVAKQTVTPVQRRQIERIVKNFKLEVQAA